MFRNAAQCRKSGSIAFALLSSNTKEYPLKTFTPVAYIIAVGLVAFCTLMSTAVSQESSTLQSGGVRDGSHDFDFIYGKLGMPNHRLKKRLAGSNEWDDFITCDEGNPLPGGIGNIDYWKASYWKDFVGVTVRTYDPKTGLWCIYWVDNTFSEGVIQPPVAGMFEGNVGIFEGSDTFNGVPILVRFTWTVNPKASQTAAKWEQTLNPKGAPVIAMWEQAFSKDNGKTWETNWYNEFINDDSCTPTP
jgi:hypothetical protein